MPQNRSMLRKSRLVIMTCLRLTCYLQLHKIYRQHSVHKVQLCTLQQQPATSGSGKYRLTDDGIRQGEHLRDAIGME